MYDKNGKHIKIYDDVIVDDPDYNEDDWNHSFLGKVIAIDEHHNSVTVMDSDDSIFEVDSDKITIDI